MDKLSNLPDLLGLHIGNATGALPVVMLTVIFVLAVVMAVCNHQVRFCDRQHYYPALYTLFGLTLAVVYCYAFLGGLPTADGRACIGWYCRTSEVGLAWAIVGIVATSWVAYALLIATMQIVAQLSATGGMDMGEKPWKEWQWVLIVELTGATLAGVGYVINHTVGGWLLVVTTVLSVAAVVVKIVRDTAHCGRFLRALLIGVVFLLGSAASMIFAIEVIHSCVYLTIFLVAYLSMSKARKKKKDKK